MLVVIVAMYWQQYQVNDCQTRSNAAFWAGINARQAAAQASSLVAIAAYDERVEYFDKLKGYMDLAQMLGVQGAGSATITQDYRASIDAVRAAEARARDAEAEINRVRNSTGGAPPDCSRLPESTAQVQIPGS